MNCEELKDQWLADPHNLNAESKQHLVECLCCQKFNQTGLEREARLMGAFNVPTDQELTERVLANTAVQRASRPARGNFKRWLPMAAAACLAVVVGVQMRSVPTNTSTSQAFASAMIEHIDHEPDALKAVISLPIERVNQVMQRVGLAWSGAMDSVVFAEICPMMGKKMVHMVVQSDMGPVTVMVATADERQQIEQAYGNYQLASVQINGSNAILAAENREALEMVEQKLRSQLKPAVTV